MNIPALDLQEFIKEYASLTLPGQRVLRGDFFRCRDGQTWRISLIVEQNLQQCLADTTGHIWGRYDWIVPLFIASPTKASVAVQDLLEQLSGLRSRVPQEDYEKARRHLQTLCYTSQPLVPAYLVMQGGRKGIVDPAGTVIVPTKYGAIRPFAFADPGDAGVFLCTEDNQQLNAMDIYDWTGACIFHQIGNLLPREETLLTPAISGVPQRKVKSVWILRQTVDLPFPEIPDFQQVQEVPKRYSLQELRRPGSDDLRQGPMEDRPFWHWEERPPRDVLSPLAAAIGEQIGSPADSVLARLPDYQAFRKERIPLSVRLAHVTAHTPLDQLGLGIRTYHCLVRNGLQTAGDVMALSEDAIPRLPRGTDVTVRDITALRAALIELGKKP